MTDDRIVDEVLRTNSDGEIPPDVEAAMRTQFAEFRERLDRPGGRWGEMLAVIGGRGAIRWAVAGVALSVVIAIVFVGAGMNGNRVYAAAVSRLAAAKSVQYTIEIAPFVSVAFSHLGPARDRIETSWGIEIRTDGSGAQLVLLHASKQFVREQKDSGGLTSTADLVQQLASLPKKADSALGERTIDGRQFVGYRIDGTRMAGGHGVAWLDLWLDAQTGTPDHVDITPSGSQASGYQMHIRQIRVDGAIDPALFNMTPPLGYTEVGPDSAVRPGQSASPSGVTLQPQIAHVDPQRAVVVQMSGPFEQAGAAAARVLQHLAQLGVVPTGPAFGRFESESSWQVGYAVPESTRVAPPFEATTVPGGLVASVRVGGPWGQDSGPRWSRMLTWLGDHAYVSVGPPTEMWSGDAARPDSQSTEMRVAVAPAGGAARGQSSRR
jgi:hypothetical protein